MSCKYEFENLINTINEEAKKVIYDKKLNKFKYIVICLLLLAGIIMKVGNLSIMVFLILIGINTLEYYFIIERKHFVLDHITNTIKIITVNNDVDDKKELLFKLYNVLDKLNKLNKKGRL